MTGKEGKSPPPRDKVKGDPYFWQCIKSLRWLLREETPAEVTVQSNKGLILIYGYVNASGGGFGESLLIKNHAHYRIGTWGKDEEDNSSNWREFENVVVGMEDAGKKGWLLGAVVLLATDNEVVERALYKGNSSSKIIFNLVLRLKGLQLAYSCKIVVTHVSGLRMIYQGTDGISRGKLEQGVSIGQYMLLHCPWGTSALTASETLLQVLRSWNKKILTRLEPRDWFDLGHNIQAW